LFCFIGFTPGGNPVGGTFLQKKSQKSPKSRKTSKNSLALRVKIRYNMPVNNKTTNMSNNKTIYLDNKHWFPRTALVMYTADNTWAVTIRHTSPRKQKEFKSYKNAEYWAKRMGAISIVQVAGDNIDHMRAQANGLVLSHIMLDPAPFKTTDFLK
jgi:hypothetical protein